MTIRNWALKLGLPLAVAALALPAMAENVTFTTSGTFGCGSAVVCSLSNGGSTITVTNNGNTATDTAVGYTYTNLLAGNTPSADVNVMEFDDTSTANGTQGASVNGSTFTLHITQSAPTAGAGTLSGNFSGTIYYKNTNAFIDFGNNTTLVLGNITYTLDSSQWDMANPGHTVGMSFQTAQVTPEPTFLLLTGLGFSCLAFVAWRRKRTA